jgi:hypothetical protein
MVIAKSSNGDVGVAYLPDNATIHLEMDSFHSGLKAKWFNPLNGTYHDNSGSLPSSGAHEFHRPGDGDWLLLLQARSDD